MANDADICNMALLRSGKTSTIASLDEKSTEASVCRAFYATTRDAVLRALPWPFATRRAFLAPSDEPAPTNWGFAYALPSDCLLIRSVVVPGMRLSRVDQRIPYESAGTRIYTDQSQVELLYTARIDDSTLFDSQFISALAWALAVEFALCLAIKPDLANLARQAYRLAVSEAWASAASESSELAPESEFIAVRS